MASFLRAATLRSLLLGATAAVGATPSPAYAQEQQQVRFHIAPQSTADALNEFARQAGVQILFPYERAAQTHAPSIDGSFTRDEALRRIIAGTSLVLASNDGRTIVLSDSASPTRLGAVSPATPSDIAGESAAIVVIGSNIRGANRTAPVTVLDRDQIDSTGAASATRLIESLPQNYALATPAGVETPGVSSPREQGSAINLRGIGEGTTLVLLNGRRLPLSYLGSAVDVSALPLSAVERVEVLTDGASALYGSDAVGGVVNFVLREDFEGAETRVRAGVADGLNEYRASQTFGADWGSGNAVVSGEYYYRDALETADRDFVQPGVLIGTLYPQDENLSLFGAIRQQLMPNLEAFAEGLWVNRKSENAGGRVNLVFNERMEWDNEQAQGTIGLNWDLANEWRIAGSASYAGAQNDGIAQNLVAGPVSDLDQRFETLAFDLKGDGPLFTAPGGQARMAIGVSSRLETLDVFNSANGFPGFTFEGEQTVNSVYSELRVPLLENLELSLAGRYDDYSTFGNSFDPRVGLFWQVNDDLSFRGSWGTSYVAPKLTDYNAANNSGAALFLPDEGTGGFTYQMQIAGVDFENLEAQESESISLGFEFAPSSLEGLRLGANYFEIEYTNQISGAPSPSVLLGNSELFPNIVIRDPTIAQVNEYIAIAEASGLPFFPFNPDFTPNLTFTPDQIDVIIDARRRNLSATETKGFDFFVNYSFPVAAGDMTLGLEGTHLLERTQRITETSPEFETAGTLNNPADWRVRGSAGWRNETWAANLFVNYTDAYIDNRAPVTREIDSYTTVDTRLAYTFSEVTGLTIALSAQNLFDQDPPAVAVTGPFDLGFDATNSNPIGRLVAIELTKRW